MEPFTASKRSLSKQQLPRISMSTVLNTQKFSCMRKGVTHE